MRSLAGAQVVITGAASGIGLALAHDLARHRCRLLLADIDAAGVAALAVQLAAGGTECHALATDVGRHEDLLALAERARSLWGGVDLVIQNAGVALVAPVATLEPADARWLFDINFWAIVHGAQAFLPLLRGRPAATLVNVSSIFAMLSMPTQSIYNASKAAVRAFSDAVREEWRAEGVHVLCVHPGGVRTRIVEQARLGDLSLVADDAAALQSQFLAHAPTRADEAATAIVAAIRRGDTRLLVGPDARIGDWLFRLAPARASAWLSALARRRRRRAAARDPQP
jgi:butyryl-CoA dehydrogenase